MNEDIFTDCKYVLEGTIYPNFVSITTIAEPENDIQLMNYMVRIEALQIQCTTTGVLLLTSNTILYRNKMRETIEIT